MIAKKSVKTVSKAFTVIGIVLLLIASYIGYSSIINEFRAYIETNQVSTLQLHSFYSQMQIFALIFVGVVLVIALPLSIMVKGKFKFITWIKWSFIAVFAFVAGIGFYLYAMKQTGFYNDLLIPILPVVYLLLIGIATLYTTLPDELIKELSTKEGRKEISRRISERERQRKLMKQHQ